MMNVKLPREQKAALIEAVRDYFETERGESIGSIAAEQMTDAMITLIGPYIYNQAISDARKVVNERTLTLEDELFSLEKRL